jgi:hypothetical protein
VLVPKPASSNVFGKRETDRMAAIRCKERDECNRLLGKGQIEGRLGDDYVR